MHLVAVLKGRTAVIGPGQLSDAGVALDALDAEARMEALTAAG